MLYQPNRGYDNAVVKIEDPCSLISLVLIYLSELWVTYVITLDLIKLSILYLWYICVDLFEQNAGKVCG